MKETLSYLAQKFQSFLFPIVENHLQDELLDKHWKLIKILEVLQIEQYLPQKIPGTKGRPPKHTSKIARAFIAKHVLNIKTTSQLIYLLRVDKNLRYICGWEPLEKVAGESTFSRVFLLLSESNLLEKVHEKLGKNIFSRHVVLHNSRDSVPVPAREWPVDGEGNKIPRKKRKKKEKKKYPVKKDTVSSKQSRSNLSVEEMLKMVPTKCDTGKKANSSGKAYCWRGYKLHLDVADGWFPLSCLLTSGSSHDTQAAIPLSKISSERANVCYELMDSAYDSEPIRSWVSRKGRVPLISDRIWRGKRGENTKRELKARKNLRFRPADAKRLSFRMSSERLFARLQDHFSGMSVWVRGYSKVKCHVMLSILSLAADEFCRRLC